MKFMQSNCTIIKCHFTCSFFLFSAANFFASLCLRACFACWCFRHNGTRACKTPDRIIERPPYMKVASAFPVASLRIPPMGIPINVAIPIINELIPKAFVRLSRPRHRTKITCLSVLKKAENKSSDIRLHSSRLSKWLKTYQNRIQKFVIKRIAELLQSKVDVCFCQDTSREHSTLIQN